MAKIKITRAFSRTIQLRQFEPVNAYCSAEVEVEIEPREFIAQRGAIASDLDEFVRKEVGKTIAIVRPPLKDRDPKSATTKSKDIGIETAEAETVEEVNQEQ